MTVLLVLSIFLAFVVLDGVLNHRKRMATVQAEAAQAGPALAGSDYIDGFLVPPDVSYHAGHTWLRCGPDGLARVGADEFGAALAGRVEKIELPATGQLVRQGQRIVSFIRDGQKAEVVSPGEGQIVAVNPEIAENPALLRQDPYGEGWLLSLRPTEGLDFTRNLLPKSLVGDWMRESVERLYALQPQLGGRVAYDGGRPAEDLLAGIAGADWKQTTARFFLTE
jgi:glycine cleavage system H protein